MRYNDTNSIVAHITSITTLLFLAATHPSILFYPYKLRTRKEEGAMMDRERPSASELEAKIPEAWIGQEVMLETTETLSSDLRASAPTYLEDVNERGVVMLVTRHKDQSQFSRYFYPWSVVGWIRLAEEDERSGPRAGSS